MSIELIRISDSPSHAPRGTAFGGVLVLHVGQPKSPTSVTVRLNREAQEHPTSPANDCQATIPHHTAGASTDESQELFFDLSSSSAHTVKVRNQGYKITLMQIGSEKGTPWYEFQVTTL